MTNLWFSAALDARNSMVFRSGSNATFGVHFTQPDTEDKKLRKELTLEVLALKVPFGYLLLPNEVPWPGQLRT
jgi:hypothetical protein